MKNDSLVSEQVQELEMENAALREEIKHLRGAKMNKMQEQVTDADIICHGIKLAIEDSHSAAVACGWYTDLDTEQPKKMNDGERFMLMVSEIAEAMEGVRKNLMDDKLPHRRMVEVELADLLIRVFDFAGANNLDLAGAYIEKRAFNDHRPDHKPENRKLDGGKQF